MVEILAPKLALEFIRSVVVMVERPVTLTNSHRYKLTTQSRS